MFNRLFDNPGAKIKLIAKILFWVGAVACVILAFKLGWTKEYIFSRYDSYTKFHPDVFFPLLLGGPIGSYLSSLLLFSYGCLVESNSTY